MIRKNEENESKAILAILLSLAVYWIWSAQYMPQPEAEGTPPAVSVAEGSANEAEVVADTPSVDAAPVASTPTDLPERSASLSSEDLRGELSTHGGGFRKIALLQQYEPFEVEPIWQRAWNMVTGDADEDWKPYGEEPGLETLLGEDAILAAAGSGTWEDGAYNMISEDPVTFERVIDGGLKITKTYSLGEEPDLFNVSVSFENVGASAWQQPRWVGAIDTFTGEAGRYESVVRPAGYAGGSLESQDDLEELDVGPQSYSGPVSWLGLGDTYFLTALIPSDPNWGSLSFADASAGQTAAEGQRAGVYIVNRDPLAPGQVDTLGFTVYAGSKQLDRLKELENDLAKAADFGFFGFFAKALLWVLQRFHDVVGNWGVAIMLLTVMVKAAFWPLTQKSFKSNRAMQALQPQLTELREKYADDPQAAGVKQMELFKEAGVNPLSGCLPMFVQMPIWFSLYSTLLYAADIYHAEFLYLKDLSSPDPTGIFPTIVGILMVLQQRLMPTSANMDPTQQMIMKAMPLVFVFFIYAFPSGLAVYIFVNTLMSILQMWLINRAYPIQQPATT